MHGLSVCGPHGISNPFEMVDTDAQFETTDGFDKAGSLFRHLRYLTPEGRICSLRNSSSCCSPSVWMPAPVAETIGPPVELQLQTVIPALDAEGLR